MIVLIKRNGKEYVLLPYEMKNLKDHSENFHINCNRILLQEQILKDYYPIATDYLYQNIINLTPLL